MALSGSFLCTLEEERSGIGLEQEQQQLQRQEERRLGILKLIMPGRGAADVTYSRPDRTYINRAASWRWRDLLRAGFVACFLFSVTMARGAGATRKTMAKNTIPASGESVLQGDEEAQGITSDYQRLPPKANIGRQMSRAFRKEKDGGVATQVHISLNGPNHMHISWITKDSGKPSSVEYGTVPGVYTGSAQGKTTSYSYVLYKSGEIHDTVIGPLQDNTVYYYRLGGGTVEYSFRTPPGPGPEIPINFVVCGDLGQTGWTTSTLEHIKGTDYDMMLYSGDLSYADYYQPLWDSFGELVSPLTSARPWMVTQGNHEKEFVPLLIEAFRAYNARWSMPFAESASTSNLFYSFEVAGCHILMLGSYTDYSPSSAQYKWLQADLAKVNRAKTPWLIAVLHAPWYNSNTAHQGDGDAMMASIEPLLFAAKVDILFAGHVHAYERTTRVYKGVANPLGIVHITIGDGGNREGLASNYISPQPKWSLFREASFGHGRFNIQNSTTAHWSWHRNDDANDRLADEVLITSLSDPNNPAYKTTTIAPEVTPTSTTKTVPGSVIGGDTVEAKI